MSWPQSRSPGKWEGRCARRSPIRSRRSPTLGRSPTPGNCEGLSPKPGRSPTPGNAGRCEGRSIPGRSPRPGRVSGRRPIRGRSPVPGTIPGRIEGRVPGVMPGRVDGIEGRVEGIDGRVDGIDGRVEGIEGRVPTEGRLKLGADGRVDGRLKLGVDGRVTLGRLILGLEPPRLPIQRPQRRPRLTRSPSATACSHRYRGFR